MDSNLVRRVGFAVVAIPLALAVIWYGGLPLAFLLALTSALGARELFDLAGRQGVRPARALGFVSAAAVAPVAYVALVAPDVRALVLASWPYLVGLWVIVLLTWALAARSPAEKPLEAAGVTLLAVVYTGVLPAFLIGIRHLSHPERSWAGAWLVFFPLVVTWVCDTAAMFGGRLWAVPSSRPRSAPERPARAPPRASSADSWWLRSSAPWCFRESDSRSRSGSFWCWPGCCRSSDRSATLPSPFSSVRPG